MRYIHNIEFILLNLVDDEVKREIKNLKRRYPEAFLEGGIGKKGETKDVEDILKKLSIHHEKVIMPETIDLKFF